ncbi:RagB/SusD family nutrient uptake outer membrane protein [Croceitalea sp. MTPC9]|nr:RagB/SusD family nutrient uptake outer membrane protein [Croceitalea sp. MTPC6]GMN16995.1 RagB/SusD family nutrient uptake outer membrane protein [Croceitalea sp. MTPC9]
MMKKDFLQNKLIKTLGVSLLLVTSQACTDLEPNFQDSISVESDGGSFSGVSSASSSLEALYTSGDSDGIGLFRQDSQESSYALMEVSAENIAVLTRGADWGDNGVWRTLHNHTWDPNHFYVLQAWNRHNAATFRANQLIDSRSNANPSQLAQAQVIRAFHVYSILDFFGQVPIRGVDDGPDVNPTVLSAQEAFAFILDDLNTALSSGNLSSNGPDAPLKPADSGADRAGTLSGVGEAFARFLRARVQLNAIHLVGSEGDMNQVISDINAIEALGFQLDGIGADDPDNDESYFDIWDPANNTNQEVIFMLEGDIRTRMYNQLHPNQGGWNGFVTLTETFRLFGTDDVAQDARLGLPGEEVAGVSTGYIRGQQRNVSGENLTDRQENPLVYEDVILTNLEVNNERNGIRIVKNPQRAADGNLPGDTFRDFAWMRFSDAVLMRAEATLRGGTGGPSALADVNAIRERAGAAPLGSVTLDDMQDIIARELNAEGVMGGRRAVQLRFGTFASDTWEMKNVTDAFRVKFPVPAAALATNPNLTQNEGY